MTEKKKSAKDEEELQKFRGWGKNFQGGHNIKYIILPEYRGILYYIPPCIRRCHFGLPTVINNPLRKVFSVLLRGGRGGVVLTAVTDVKYLQ